MFGPAPPWGLQTNEEKVTVQNKSFRAHRRETALGVVLDTPDEIQGAREWLKTVLIALLTG